MALGPSGPSTEAVNILLVDDTPANLLSLEAVLERPDYNLVTATSGEDALRHLRETSFAVILLDVMMPGIDGYGVARRAKALEQSRDTPLIFITAIASDTGHVTKGYAHGAADYLTKPIDAEEVQAKVAVFVELYRKNLRLQKADEALRALNKDLEQRAESRARGLAASNERFTADKKAKDILRESQEAVQASHKWFESVIDLMPIAVVVVDLETASVLSTNKAAHELTGDGYPITLPPDDDTRHYATDSAGRVIPTKNWPRFRTARGESLRALEMTWHWPGGSIPLIVNSTVLPPMHGKPGRGIIVFQDIRARKDAEVKLRQSEEKFRTLANSIPQLAWKADAKGSIYWYNQRWYDYTGTTFDEVEGWGWRKVHHPDHVERVAAHFKSCIENGEPWEDLFPLRSGDGGYRWFLSRAVPIRSEDDQIVEWFGTNTDVTDSRVAEEVGGRLAAIAESSDDAIISKSLTGVIESWNEGAEAIFGYTAAEAIGKPITILVPNDMLDEDLEFMETVLRGDRISHRPTVRVRKDGTVVHVLVSISPVRDSTGKIVGIAKVARDITLQKQAEEELRRAKEVAEEANRSKSQFLANMSHEIRTPLNAIVGFADLLDEPELPEEDRKGFGATIRRNGRLLSELIDDILDLSKVEAGKLTIERIRCHLPSLLDEVRTLLGHQARDKDLQLKVCSDGEVPEYITSDPMRVKQILINIIGNAIKFTSQGGVFVRAKFMGAQEDGGISKVFFTVKDTGRGISAEQAKKLFQPFTQADASTTRTYGGTGLGLALARRLAEALGGTVELTESDIGHGSTFTISIETGKTEGWTIIGARTKAREEGLRALQGNRALSGLRILVVEDSLDSRRLLDRVLKGGGAEVELAEDGAEAIEMAMAHDPDVILMDLQMPRVDGLQATENLRRRGFGKPIIALTAHAMKEERERCLRSGATDHVGKPINIAELVHKIAEHTQAPLN